VAVGPRIAAFGEQALMVELGDVFDETMVARARAIADAWERLGHGPALPAYTSVVLHFDARRKSLETAEHDASDVIARAAPAVSTGTARLIEIPTVYDGEDLTDTAARSGMSVEELIRLHAGRDYTAYFLGFLSAFAYLGRIDPRIVAPRLERPRTRVPAGTVAIADGQTGVYPLTSPGGWRLIGRTDVVIFDPSAADPARIHAGDRVRFVRR